MCFTDGRYMNETWGEGDSGGGDEGGMDGWWREEECSMASFPILTSLPVRGGAPVVRERVRYAMPLRRSGKLK